jgi:hypothetical protein
MPALFAYILAVVLLIGGGYAGLHWLTEPPPVTNHGGKEPAKAKKTAEKTAEKTQPHPDADSGRSTELRPSPSSVPSEPSAKAAADPQPAGDPSKDAQARTDGNPAKDAADVPRGGCMPWGITGKGELVFPMECQAILAQNGAGQTPRQPTVADSTPAAKQTEARQTEAKETGTAAHADAAPSNPAPTPNEPAAADPDQKAKIEDRPSAVGAGTKPGKGSAETEAIKTKEATRKASKPSRPSKTSHPKGVMMVLRTIEFPDGHREQRLLSLDHWGRVPFRPDDDEW